MDKKDKKFIQKIAKEAIMHVRKTRDATGRQATILKYREFDYFRIKCHLPQINEITSKENVGVSITDKHLKENEVRFFYLE